MASYPFENAANIIQAAVLLIILIISVRKYFAEPNPVLGLIAVASACMLIGDLYWISLRFIESDKIYKLNAMDISLFGNLLLLYSAIKLGLGQRPVRKIVCPGTIAAAIFGVIMAAAWIMWSGAWVSSILEALILTLLGCAAVINIESGGSIQGKNIVAYSVAFLAAAVCQFILMKTDGTIYTVTDIISSLLLGLIVVSLIVISFKAEKHRFSFGILAYVSAIYAEGMCAGIYYSLAMMLVTISYILVFIRVDDFRQEEGL